MTEPSYCDPLLVVFVNRKQKLDIPALYKERQKKAHDHAKLKLMLTSGPFPVKLNQDRLSFSEFRGGFSKDQNPII
jgi:hypothetical protein